MTARVGVLPAAGMGTRSSPLAYPKELLPVPRPVILASLDQLAGAGVGRAVVVVAGWKLELVRALGARQAGVDLGYVVREPRGLADAVVATQPWTADAVVCLALPDTVVEPPDALARVADEVAAGADLALGVFPTEHPELLGPVRHDGRGQVLEVLDKPASRAPRNTWGVAAWAPRFGALLRAAVAVDPGVVLGAVFQRAVVEGLTVRAVAFEAGAFLDVGLPEGFAAAVARAAR